MSNHSATIHWKRETADFTYDSYNRAHRWSFDGGPDVAATSAPDFGGDAQRVDPEEAFVASLASCHMLTFLAIAVRKRLTIDEYIDEAVGFLEKRSDGKLAITRVLLRPRISFGGEANPSKEEIDSMHHEAHERCFIANSVLTTITVEPG